MPRPRFTLTRIALAGAGLLTAAGIGAAAVPAALAATPAASGSASTTTPSPKASPAPGSKAATRGGHPGLALHRELVTLVAGQTGLTLEQVRAELKAGKSLDDIAGSKAQAVRDAALDAVTKRLDALRAAGKITQAQETKRLAHARARIARVMAAVPHHRAAAAA